MTNQNYFIIGGTLIGFGCLVLAIIFFSKKRKSSPVYRYENLEDKYFWHIISFVLILFGLTVIIPGAIKKEDYGYSYTEEDEKKRMKNDIYQLDKF
jgi:hypothetical protein